MLPVCLQMWVQSKKQDQKCVQGIVKALSQRSVTQTFGCFYKHEEDNESETLEHDEET